MNTIDLSQLPPPRILEMPKFKALKAKRLAELQALDPAFNAVVESDPCMKLLEISVYREMVNVARFNNGILAVLLAYAKGSDLDQIGANYEVYRLVVTPADNTTIPPTDAVMESDDAFRRRIRLSWYARNTAGSIQAYEYFALSADGTVLDAKAYGPQESADIPPGDVHVYVLSSEGDGTPSNALLQKVTDALSAKFTRPLTDYVSVLPATIIPYDVEATLLIASGPDADTVEQASAKAVQRYADKVHKIAVKVSKAGIDRALMQPGVDDVELDSPTATIAPGIGEAPFCTAINLTIERDGDVPDTPTS